MRRMGHRTRNPGIEKRTGPEGTRYIAHAAKRMPGGKRETWQGTFTTEKEALAERNKWLVAHDRRQTVKRTKKTVKDILESWFAAHTKGKAPKTVLSYRGTLNTHLLKSPLASIYVYDLTGEMIQEYYNSLTVGVRTGEMIHMRLSQALDYAVKHHYIPRNYTKDCEIARSKPRRGIALDPAQVAAFLVHGAHDHYHPLWHLAFATGMRRGELLGVRWSDIDLDKGAILMQQTNVWLGKPSLQDHGKTPSSLRSIKLNAEMTALLKLHKASQSKRIELAGDTWEKNDLVFCTAIGRPLGAPNVHRTYKALLTKAGLPDNVVIHDMRHTHLSALIDAGVPIATVAERGGYKNAAVLLSVYTHAYAASHEAAAEAAARLVFGPSKDFGKEVASK